jgi:cation:H+ antiporter
VLPEELPQVITWILFCVSVLLVLYGGVRLTRSGDMIAEKTGIDRAWIGLVIISFATTLPELVTSVSSILLVKEPDLAAGNCFGSMAFNLLLVTFMDLFGNRRLVREEMNRGLYLSAGIFLLLLLVIQFSLFSLQLSWLPTFSFGNVDSSSFFIIAVYFLTSRLIFTYGRNDVSSSEPVSEELTYADHTLGKSFLLYLLAAFCVLVGGMLLAETANRIAIETGIGQTFVGSTAVGITTSLPEMVVAFTAIRLGAHEMVLGNILGANLFNLIIVALCDLLYPQSVLLSSIDINHSVTILLVLLMTTVVMLGQFSPPRRKVAGLGWDSLSLFFLYGVGVTLLFGLGLH